MLPTTGYVIEEEILYSGLKKLEGGIFYYRVKLRAKVAEPKGQRNSALSLELSVKENFLRDGDKLSIRVKPSFDGYLYLFNFLPAGIFKTSYL